MNNLDDIKPEDREVYIVENMLHFLAKVGNHIAQRYAGFKFYWDPDANGGHGGEYRVVEWAK